MSFSVYMNLNRKGLGINSFCRFKLRLRCLWSLFMARRWVTNACGNNIRHESLTNYLYPRLIRPLAFIKVFKPEIIGLSYRTTTRLILLFKRTIEVPRNERWTLLNINNYLQLIPKYQFVPRDGRTINSCNYPFRFWRVRAHNVTDKIVIYNSNFKVDIVLPTQN